MGDVIEELDVLWPHLAELASGYVDSFLITKQAVGFCQWHEHVLGLLVFFNLFPLLIFRSDDNPILATWGLPWDVIFFVEWNNLLYDITIDCWSSWLGRSGCAFDFEAQVSCNCRCYGLLFSWRSWQGWSDLTDSFSHRLPWSVGLLATVRCYDMELPMDVFILLTFVFFMTSSP